VSLRCARGLVGLFDRSLFIYSRLFIRLFSYSTYMCVVIVGELPHSVAEVRLGVSRSLLYVSFHMFTSFYTSLFMFST